jgi:hypothetical protein
MKNFDSRTYSINDFLEWSNNKQLELAPKFQRNSVWSENAKSYLMDTIITGYPIPKVFIRQKLNIQTKLSVREVVDGQQRLRTILSFLRDGFKIDKKHNEKYGGLYFSQLDSVDSEIQGVILNYEISTDLLVNMADADVLDVFGRLNSYAVILNEQEKIHANHFGPFKTLSDRIAHRYNEFWLRNQILTAKQILRMNDTSLVADLLIAMIEGIRPKNQIKPFYTAYENSFNEDSEELNNRFDAVLHVINSIFSDGLADTEFKRISIFYSLFTAFYHILYGLDSSPQRPFPLIPAGSMPSADKMRVRLDRVNVLFNTGAENLTILSKPEIQFLRDSKSSTTDITVRERRATFIIDLILS